MKTTSHKQHLSGCSDLAGGFDSFKYAEVHNEPRQEEVAAEVPANAAYVLDATGLLQKLVTVNWGAKKKKEKMKDCRS